MCRYLKRNKYCLDALLAHEILQRGARSFYAALHGGGLLRELYDFDFQIYEFLLPLLLERARARALCPAEYVSSALLGRRQRAQNPYSNLMGAGVQLLN